MKYTLGIIIVFGSLSIPSFGQIGGLRSFDFLNIPGDARTAALGGTNVSLGNGDVNTFQLNPALLDSTMTQHISLSYLSFLGGIKFSNISYAHNHSKWGNWGLNLKYIDYGTFEGFDDTGFGQGEFNANEFVMGISHSRSTGVFQLGTTMKFVYSGIYNFQAMGILVDIGGAFVHPNKDINIGLVFKNVGVLLSDYTATSNTTLPFDVQLGISFKPAHTPFRISTTVYNLYRSDIVYFDPGFEGNSFDAQKPGTVDNIFRHVLFALELIPSQNFNIRVGYNHQMRRELRLEELSGGAGFSFGLMFKIKAFEFAYSKALYHVAGSTNHLTVTSNLGKIIHKKKLIK